MAKRELSTTLKNLKFMQRAGKREQKSKTFKDEEPENTFSPILAKKCVVIMEGDPHPGAVLGRVSFGNFNPVVDKLNEAASELGQSESVKMNDINENTSCREKESSINESESTFSSPTNEKVNGNHKRKNSEGDSTVVSQNKLPRLDPSSGSGGKKSNQTKRDKLDWNVLKRSSQNTKGCELNAAAYG